MFFKCSHNGATFFRNLTNFASFTVYEIPDATVSSIKLCILVIALLTRHVTPIFARQNKYTEIEKFKKFRMRFVCFVCLSTLRSESKQNPLLYCMLLLFDNKRKSYPRPHAHNTEEELLKLCRCLKRLK